jgi:glycerophosphoryl diester phosphodiesterase
VKEHFLQYFIFEAIITTITSSVVLPFILKIYQWVLVFVGTPYVLNDSFYKVRLSSARLWTFIFGIIVVALFLLLEYIILMILTVKHINKEPVRIIDAFITGILNIRRLLIPGIVHVISMALFFIPLFLISSNFNPINIPISIYDFINGSFRNQLFAFIALIAWLYIHIHTLYLLYFMLIKNDRLREALIKSFYVVKKNQKKMILIWLPVLFGCIFLLVLINFGIQSTIYWISGLAIYMTFKKVILFCLGVVVYGVVLLTFPFYVNYMVTVFQEITTKNDSPHHNRKIEIELVVYRTKFPKLLNRLQKSRFVRFGLVIVGFFTIFSLNYNLTKSSVRWDVNIAAHRGDSSTAPENTLASIQMAIDKQVEFVELDVKLTQDSIAVLHHDTTLKRTAGVSYKITDLTYQDILMYDVGENFSTEFTGTRVPTLYEALELCKNRINVILDIKDSKNSKQLIPIVLQIINELELNETVYIQSFNSAVLTQVRRLQPDIKIGQIMYYSSGDLSQLDVDFYAIKYSMITEHFVKQAKDLNREVWVWTVNSSAMLKEVLKYDIDGIITDYPERAQLIRSTSH